MAIKLPPSLQKERYPVEREVAHVRGLTPSDRLALVWSVCRAARKVLALHPDPQRVLTRRDPLPPSTIAALRRLRGRP